MTPVIEMKPLSRTRRRFIFAASLLLFLIAVPISVFYAIGYRFDFSDRLDSIKSVGGMYVRNDAPNTEMFINNEPVVDMRVFQRASYIQNLEAGMHRIHVQGADVQTWVKELPVYAHFVTEVASFNLPKVPQIRIVTQWNDAITGEGIVFDDATSTVFSFASTTNPLRLATSTATTSYAANPEYTYLQVLFASSSELRASVEELQNPVPKKQFTFDIATSSAKALLATTTKNWREFSLYESGDEVFMSWKGDAGDVPYYYCIEYKGEKITTMEYGAHVSKALQAQFAATVTSLPTIGQRICRDSIRIDRLNQEVSWFDFYPDSTDIVLMLLDDGLYAVEVDDRAWQNTQLLYPGENLQVIQDGGRIFVKDGENYLEVFTEVVSSN